MRWEGYLANLGESREECDGRNVWLTYATGARNEMGKEFPILGDRREE
jgi:hypothetical protein